MNPKLVQQHGVVIQARPLSLQRAITNLIDNALKYGRKANVSVQADSKTASIMVDDYGDGVSVEDLCELTTLSGADTTQQTSRDLALALPSRRRLPNSMVAASLSSIGIRGFAPFSRSPDR